MASSTGASTFSVFSTATPRPQRRNSHVTPLQKCRSPRRAGNQIRLLCVPEKC
jgi:hypothetical protein